MTEPRLSDHLQRAGLPDPRSELPVELGSGTLRVASQEVNLRPGASLCAGLREAQDATSLVAGHCYDSLAEDHVVGHLELEGHAVASVVPRMRHGSVLLSLTAGAPTRLCYRHQRAFPAASSPRQVAQTLVAGACLPHQVRPDLLEPFESHALTASTDLDLGLEVYLGLSFQLPTELVARLPAPLRREAETTVRTWLGLELRDEMRLEVGRPGGGARGRIRIRLSRVGEGELSLGARLALEIAYETRRPLHALLDTLLASPGLTAVTRALDELHRLDSVESVLARGDWTTLSHHLSVEAAEVVTDLLTASGAWTAIASSESAHALLDATRQLTRAVAEAEPEVRSLWDHLVRAEQTGSFLDALRQIAALDRHDPAFLLDPSLETAVDLLELLSGYDLETLAAGGDDMEEALARAGTLAEQGLRLDRQLAVLPAPLRRRLDAFFRRTGCAAVVAAVESLDSPDALRVHAGSHLAGMVERFLGTSLERVDRTDLERLKGWARELRGLLAATDLDALEVGLRASAEELRGELGFSLAVELDRLSRNGQFLDVEIDRSSEVAARVLDLLGSGDLGQALARLFAADPDENGRPPFLIHDCALTSRRVRAGAVSLFSSLLGLGRRCRRRVTEFSLRLSQDPSSGAIERHGRHAGGAVISVRAPDGSVTQLSAWLSYHGLGSGYDFAAAYDPGLESELRLSLARRDPTGSAADLAALGCLLHDLGFLPDPQRLGPFDSDLVARFAVTIRLPGEVLEAFLACLDRTDTLARRAWCRDFDNALHRWFADLFVPTLDSCQRPHTRLGDVLAGVVLSPWYRTTVGRSEVEVEADLAARGGTLTVSATRVTAGDPFTVQLTSRPEAGTALPSPAYLPVFAAITTREQSIHQTAELQRLVHAAATSRRGPDLIAATAQAARAFAATTDLRWPNPMLLLWLLHARLCRKAPHLLALARGVATVQFKHRGAERWEQPERLPLASGLRVHPVGVPDSIFPI